MQRPDQISLNAIRVFVTVAESGSLKVAAVRLGVTPGAVSRQVLNLEAAMGVLLFNRANNSIHLTEAGAAFLRDARSGLQILHRSIGMAMGEGQAVTVQVPTTLATRWLIPLLHGFKARWPKIAVRIETNDETGLVQNPRADVTIAYFPVSEPLHHTEVLVEDRCRPYLAPSLLTRLHDPSDLSSIPALQCTTSNWDWNTWLKETRAPDVMLRFDGYFDLDDLALRAAISGMGMVLASAFMVGDDLKADRLIALPESPEVLLGHYTLHYSRHASTATAVFAKWLRSAL